MKLPYFSIIVPCYNAENYLYNTVNSIIKQSVSEWELLLIDDGSSDSTGIMCDEFSRKDSRIRAIHQKNGGVSCARNHGLDEARGEWVIFLDADDWFTDNAFDIYLKAIYNSHSDRLVFNRYYSKDGKNFPMASLSPDKLIRSGDDIKYFLIDMMFPFYDKRKNGIVTGGIRGVNCSLYRRKLLAQHHIRFEESLKIAEDALFNFDVMRHATEISMINEMAGYYRISNTSVMHRYTPDIDEINNQLLRIFKQRITMWLNTDKEYRIAWLGFVAECVFRTLKLNYLNKENKCSFKEKEKKFLLWYNQELIKDGLDYRLMDYLPLGKKQIMQCLSKNNVLGAFLIAYVSIYLLKRRNKI